MRKIIQITTRPGFSYEWGRQLSSQLALTLALCDDGTLWYSVDSSDGWGRMPEIPQDSEDVPEQANWGSLRG